jgi:PQQ-dependent catabolism-associated CXXCW motif protein
MLIAAAGVVPAEPDGFQNDDYRSTTPLTFNGRPALETPAAVRLWKSGEALFIDTLPRPPRPTGLPEGTIWRPKPRDDIPGSIWLPDTGYGALAPVMEDYFRSALDAATKGDHTKLLVFYCLADCWMSWNAAKRARTFGYTHVEWYRDGTDGWQAAGLPLEPRTPVPRPGES